MCQRHMLDTPYIHVCRRLIYTSIHPSSISWMKYSYLPLVIFNDDGTTGPFWARRNGSTAAETGVVDLVGTALRLCAMCALTKCPAASALHKLSSPARTPAAIILASCRALSPGFVGCAPRTPSISSIDDCASRMVPPPIVPTSIEGMETLIWRFPLLLEQRQ